MQRNRMHFERRPKDGRKAVFFMRKLVRRRQIGRISLQALELEQAPHLRHRAVFSLFAHSYKVFSACCHGPRLTVWMFKNLILL